MNALAEPPASLSPSLRPSIDHALKEWAVAIRALREGRQVMLLRKGGILDAGGEFQVEARDVLLFPTYLHEDEQRAALQPCYGSWLAEESRRRLADETQVRIQACATVTDIVPVHRPEALYDLSSQHIYSDSFLDFRIQNEPRKPLWALFLRAYDLPKPVLLRLQPDHYGCRSWIAFAQAVPATDARPCLSDHTYERRVEVAKRRLAK